jgi:ParB/RepB/Spo0J family partition protein
MMLEAADDRIMTEHSTQRGYLDLLARAKAALASSREVAVDVDYIRPFPDQPRRHFDAGGIARLRDSIDGSGQTTSGLIRENAGETRYELIDGERRWRAVRMIPVDRRPQYKARLIEADDEVVRYLISGIANFNREGHTPLEISDTIARLLDFGLPMREIAALLGISEHWGYQMHGLCKLAPNVRGLLDPTLPRTARLPTSAATEIAKVAPRLQWKLAQQVLSRSISLPGLRAEAVRVSRREKAPIRTREVPRDQRWKAFRRKLGVAELAVGDAARATESKEVRHFAAQRPQAEKRELLARLQSLQNEVSELVRFMQEAV